MFIVSDLSKDIIHHQQDIIAVATIEANIQPVDAWSAHTFMALLEQESIQLMVMCTDYCAPQTVSDEAICTEKKSSKIVGYCLYQQVFEQAEILRIGTHPDYQRQGIASKLLLALHVALKRCAVESLLLEVRADNTPALALYEQQAFEVIHRRRGYYQQPNLPAVDALIMQYHYD